MVLSPFKLITGSVGSSVTGFSPISVVPAENVPHNALIFCQERSCVVIFADPSPEAVTSIPVTLLVEALPKSNCVQ